MQIKYLQKLCSCHYCPISKIHPVPTYNTLRYVTEFIKQLFYNLQSVRTIADHTLAADVHRLQ